MSNTPLGTGSLFDERRTQLGEGPVWDGRTGRVYWVDILSGAIHWKHLSSGESGSYQIGPHTSAVLPREDGKWIICLPDGVYLADLDAGHRELIAAYPHSLMPEGGENILRSNDAKVSPDGSVYTGTMPYDQATHAGSAALYRLEGGALQTVFDGVTISNGIGWSPDLHLAYYVDTVTSRVDVVDVDEDGGWHNRRAFAEIPESLGYPDGLSVDSAGNVWVALWSGYRVQRISPEGEFTGYVELPAKQVTSCAFAGDDLQTMIITTSSVEDAENPAAGQTYVFTPEHPGLPGYLATA